MLGTAPNRVRELREARGLSQIDLAAAVSLTRQSIGAIEAGRAMPAVDVAMRLGQALGCTVEELFGATAIESVVPELTARAGDGRLALGHIAGRWVSYPLLGDGMRISADAISACRSENPKTQSGSSSRILSILALRKALTRGFSWRARRGRTV